MAYSNLRLYFEYYNTIFLHKAQKILNSLNITSLHLYWQNLAYHSKQRDKLNWSKGKQKDLIKYCICCIFLNELLCIHDLQLLQEIEII